MTALIRSSLCPVIPQRAENAHAGLWLTRGWRNFPEEKQESNEKTRHIETLCQQSSPSELYKLAWQRWLTTIGETDHFSCLHVQLAQRLFIGQSSASALETGICVSHSYGMPMIPGSTAKGCAHAYAKATGLPPEYRAVLFGEDEESAEGSDRLPGAACLIWHDAWWDPASSVKPFVREIVTSHHMEYYAGKPNEATDFDSPVPNAQIAAQGSFCFAIEGPYAWTKLGIDLLEKALRETGIGAKRAAGYGVMRNIPIPEWKNARVKYNVRNGSLSVEKDGKTAYAHTPKGKELLSTLPSDVQQKIRNGQFIKVTARVNEDQIVSIAM